MFRALLC